LKRSLTPKVQPVSPCPADAFEVFATSPEPTLAMAKPIVNEGSRRVRPATLLSLAAISMGATAGVLLPGPGDEAKAIEPNISQRPFPSQATGNPYQAVEPLEAKNSKEMLSLKDEAIATSPTLVLGTADPSVPTLVEQPENPKEEIRSRSDFERSASFSSSWEAKSDALSQSSISPNAANSLLDKKHDKVVSTQLNEPIEKSESEADFAPIESDTPQGPLNVAPITIESSTSVSVPNQVAKTPGFVDSNRYSEPIVIPVPPPETASVPVPTQTAPQSARAMAVPSPESAFSRPTAESIEIEVQAEFEEPNAVEPELIVPSEVAINPEQKYQVQPGDTLDAIALRYGVSRSDIINANNLANPHQIQIAQELKIPQPQSARGNGEQYETVIPGFNVVGNEEGGDQRSREEASPNAIANTNTRASVIVPTQPWTSANANSTERSKPVTASASLTQEQQPEEAENTTVVDATSNPYIERLKADIMRMREEYRAQRASETENREETVQVADTASTQSVNAEWQNDRRQRSTPVETTAHSLQVLSVQVRDNRSEVSKGTQAAQERSESDSNPATRIAVAPVPPVEYNRNTRPQTGIQVSPELPPLAPDRYLPEQPAQFDGYIWPTTGVLTSGYGRRWGRMHRGIDVAGPTGTPIVAAAAGEVVSAGWNSGGYGNLVDIRHADGSLTRYAHNSKVLVRKGQWVEQGERISLMGSTGYSTGPHLHFEVHSGGQGAVNPMALLPPR
jgi:murein DD-endopeptidase MepM/ murein hydrolase activator NlpD